MTTQSTPDAPIQDLSARLTAGATATKTLLSWCEEHGLSQGPVTVEIRQRFSPAVIPDDVLLALEPASGEAIDYRQVRLMRGTLPLAAAENWFIPQRLAAGMNDLLQTTDVPFGTVIAPLHPSRRTLAARVGPLTADPAEDPERRCDLAHPSCPEIILEHIAAILSESGTALALVKESFFFELVSFAAAPSP
ncbi:hypothetical protein ACD578_27725 (plasmid) [Microvirga sp. RSM25]|uniref:hypothetical protein n=1 Tax=Microvirga sp. RSM25 TaxID=3273802 RepID=UPI00384EFEC2